jgi:hypothetical protein
MLTLFSLLKYLLNSYFRPSTDLPYADLAPDASLPNISLCFPYRFLLLRLPPPSAVRVVLLATHQCPTFLTPSPGDPDPTPRPIEIRPRRARPLSFSLLLLSLVTSLSYLFISL